MPKPKRKTRTPLILFGEGQTEELFLGLLKQLYSKELSDKTLQVGNGGGGSPGSILLALEKKFLSVGAASTPALVLMDADIELDAEARRILEAYTDEAGECRITIVYSQPQCLEGLLLDLLDDLPARGQQTSEKLKAYFQDQYLGERNHVLKNFKKKRHDLFPRTLFEAKASHPVLQPIIEFLKQ